MIAWPIRAVLSSGVFDEVIVSTDDVEIAEVSRTEGASVPFIRPPDLSNDHAGLMEVIIHSIEWLKSNDRAPNVVACIYATAPFLAADDIRKATLLLNSRPDADFVLAVASFAAPVQRAIVEDTFGWLNFLFPEYALVRSQDVRHAFHDAGLFFIGRTEAFLTHSSTMSGKTLPYKVPRLRCQDIDTPEDWEQAASLFAFLQKQKGADDN